MPLVLSNDIVSNFVEFEQKSAAPYNVLAINIMRACIACNDANNDIIQFAIKGKWANLQGTTN